MISWLTLSTPYIDGAAKLLGLFLGGSRILKLSWISFKILLTLKTSLNKLLPRRKSLMNYWRKRKCGGAKDIELFGSPMVIRIPDFSTKRPATGKEEIRLRRLETFRVLSILTMIKLKRFS
jgi:hypothetical protein